MVLLSFSSLGFAVFVLSSLLLFHLNYVNGILLQGKNPLDQTLLPHDTAQFGPPAGTYYVTGPLIISNPVDLCTDPPPSTNYTNTILLVVRGNCPFSEKAMRAQNFRAAGVIIGNAPNSTERWIQMADPSFLSISIPAVYTLNYIYNEMVSKLTANANNTWTPTIPSSSYLCTLDSRGEYESFDMSPSSFRLTALLLLVLPAVWILVAVAYVARRYCSAQILRCKRQKKVKELPIVTFRRGMLFSQDERALHHSAEAVAATNANNANGIQQPTVEMSVLVPNGDNEEKRENATKDDDVKVDVELSQTPSTTERSIIGAKLLEDGSDSARSDRVNSTNLTGSTNSSAPLQSDVGEIPLGEQQSKKTSLTTPLSPSLRAPLRSQRFGSDDAESVKIHNDVCSICLEEFVDGTQIKILPNCLHAFHPQCIDLWLERSENCPVDRTSILVDERNRKRWCCCCC